MDFMGFEIGEMTVKAIEALRDAYGGRVVISEELLAAIEQYLYGRCDDEEEPIITFTEEEKRILSPFKEKVDKGIRELREMIGDDPNDRERANEFLASVLSTEEEDCTVKFEKVELKGDSEEREEKLEELREKLKELEEQMQKLLAFPHRGRPRTFEEPYQSSLRYPKSWERRMMLLKDGLEKHPELIGGRSRLSLSELRRILLLEGILRWEEKLRELEKEEE
ncbi:MAG: hypothetical protein D6717_13695 [Gammaproteobacteria bacterium]|nr:MAG: hypothetical protein D6717_13695 [Gammaproteobacteria bacterium]